MNPQFPGEKGPGNFGGVEFFNLIHSPKRDNPVPGDPPKAAEKQAVLVKPPGIFKPALHHRQHILRGYVVIPVEGPHHFYFFVIT